MCRLANLWQQQGNTTWKSPNELHCFFKDVLSDATSTPLCVELSIDGGFTFTDSCTNVLKSERLPLVDDIFTPGHSHVKDPVTLTIPGKYFSQSDEYLCLFVSSEKTLTTTVTYISETLVSCSSPEVFAEDSGASYELQVSLHSAKSGLRLHRFSKSFVYLSYLKITELD